MENEQHPDGYVFVPWTLPDSTKIDLITPQILPELAEGTELISILGKTAIVGIDFIDPEGEYGVLAYGLPSRATDNLSYRAQIPEEYRRKSS